MTDTAPAADRAAPAQSTMSIHPQAALQETALLAEHYRNRCLVLAHQALELRHTVELQAAEIARLKAEEE